jgi:hypothetical protein
MEQQTQTEVIPKKAEILTGPAPESPAAHLRERKLSVEHLQDGDSRGVFKTIAEDYLQTNAEADDSGADELRETYYELRERDQKINYDHEPLATIAVPIAIHNETPETILHTLSEVVHQDKADETEVILFANHPEDLSEEEKSAAQQKLDDIVVQFGNAENQVPLAVRSVLREYPPDELHMGNIRKDMMDLITVDALDRGYNFDHPVLWLDADTRKMSRNTVVTLADSIRDPQAGDPIRRANILFGLDDTTEMDDAKRMVAAFELMRRSRVREGKNAGYSEEHGTIISLGAYDLVGGTNREEPINEAKSLKDNFKKAKNEYEQVLNKAKPGATVPRRESLILPSARIVSSARRHEDMFRQLITPEETPYTGTYRAWLEQGLPYNNFTHTDSVRSGEYAVPANFRDDEHKTKVVDAFYGPRRLQSRLDQNRHLSSPELQRVKRREQIILGRFAYDASSRVEVSK